MSVTLLAGLRERPVGVRHFGVPSADRPAGLFAHGRVGGNHQDFAVVTRVVLGERGNSEGKKKNGEENYLFHVHIFVLE